MKKLNKRMRGLFWLGAFDLVLIMLMILVAVADASTPDVIRVIEPIPVESISIEVTLPVIVDAQEKSFVGDTITNTDKSNDSYDIEELILAAQVVHSEAGNQDQHGKRLVAAVILNRVDSIYFPDTIAEVISQEGQFARGTDYTADDLEAVKDELDKRSDFDIFYFRTNRYHRVGKPAYKYGNHYFNYL